MNIAIVGGGILGRLLSWQAAEKGFTVTLFDENAKTERNNCSYMAAGMLTPIIEAEKSNHLILQLGKRSLLLWPTILNALKHDIYFKQVGSLLLAHRAQLQDLQHFVTKLTPMITTEKNQLQYLTHTELTALEPELTHFSTAYYFPEDAQLDNQQLLDALAVEIETAVNCQWQTKISTIAAHVVETHDQRYLFDWVFDCRGLSAKSVFPQLRGVRGELIWVSAPEVKLNRMVRLLHPRYALYIVPRPNHIYLIGASEIETEDLSPISLRTSLELMSAAYSIHKSFAESRLLNTSVHCRPTLIDHGPKILWEKGMIAINGLYRHGFLLAPALVEQALIKIEQPTGLIPESSELWEHKNVNYQIG